MKYRELGKTGLKVSEIALAAKALMAKTPLLRRKCLNLLWQRA